MEVELKHTRKPGDSEASPHIAYNLNLRKPNSGKRPSSCIICNMVPAYPFDMSMALSICTPLVK